MNKQKLYILISSIVGILAALMPWVSVTAFRSVTQTVSGIDGDGKITLVLFAIACALCFVGNKQEKFSQQFVYGLWAVGGLNILIFLMLFSRAGEAAKSVYGFGSVGLGHGAFLTFLAALAIILFTVEQLQLVDKVDGLIKNKTGQKVAAPTPEEVSVKEVVVVKESISENEAPVVEKTQVVEQLPENVLEDVTVQTETNQVVENVEETVEQEQETELAVLENQDAEELPSENKEV